MWNISWNFSISLQCLCFCDSYLTTNRNWCRSSYLNSVCSLSPNFPVTFVVLTLLFYPHYVPPLLSIHRRLVKSLVFKKYGTLFISLRRRSVEKGRNSHFLRGNVALELDRGTGSKYPLAAGDAFFFLYLGIFFTFSCFMLVPF